MKKKLFTLLLCAFAVIRTNAGTVSQDGLTYTIDGSEQISNLKASDMPETVKTIKLTGTISERATNHTWSISGTWGFKGFKDLTNIIWPNDNSVSVLPDYAFYGCTGLTSVTIPNSVEVIGSQAFSDCTSLATLDYQETSKVKIFGGEAFKNTALVSVTIPGSALLINTNAFGIISALKIITFAEDCTSDLIIKTQAFDNSSNVTDVYVLTSNHIQCESDAFEDDYTYAHGQINAPKASLHFPEDEADYYTNMSHVLTDDIAQDPGLLQAWLVEHYADAANGETGTVGWREFVTTGSSDPDNPDPGYVSGKFLRTYSHAKYAHIVPDGVRAYIVNKITLNNTTNLYEVTLKPIDVIPARTGVILYGQTNSTNEDKKPALSLTLISLGTKISDGQNATIKRDGEKYKDAAGVEHTVDLSLRRSNWNAPYEFVQGYKNYLEPTAKEDNSSSVLNPFDLEDGKVAYRNFGFGHYYKTTIKDTRYEDYAGFFRCKNNSKISSGKAFLKLSASEFQDSEGMELVIMKDENYYKKAKAKSSTTAISETTTYYDERYIIVGGEEKETGYWKDAIWEKPEDFGVRNKAIVAAKFFGEPVVEDETTGVVKIYVPANDDIYYNLQGVRVLNPTHGVYVKNGKKVILK